MTLRPDPAVRLVQGDTAPDLNFTLTNRDTGEPLDLTDVVSAVFAFRKVGTTTVLDTINMTVETPKTEGRLSMPWEATSLDQDPGLYEGEITLTDAQNKVRTIFEVVTFEIRADF